MNIGQGEHRQEENAKEHSGMVGRWTCFTSRVRALLIQQLPHPLALPSIFFLLIFFWLLLALDTLKILFKKSEKKKYQETKRKFNLDFSLDNSRFLFKKKKEIQLSYSQFNHFRLQKLFPEKCRVRLTKSESFQKLLFRAWCVVVVALPLRCPLAVILHQYNKNQMQ